MAAAEPGRITLLTDFGFADGYAAAMRGVIAQRAPGVMVDDAGHGIEPGDIAGAAAALARYWLEYPAGTVHIVVVDPGVGGSRRGLLVRAAGRAAVGPDNGVLTPLLESPGPVGVIEIRNAALFRHPVSATFHGRDVFAPVAAFIAQGGLDDDVGPAVFDPVRLPLPELVATPAGFRGVVTGSDRFGNLATNVPARLALGAAEVRVGGRSVGRVRETYSAAAPGELLALIGSGGFLEIAVRDGSAAARLAAGRGVVVEGTAGPATMKAGR
jgi:hypothetical protein